jgi:pantoate--beta-alanine ligase
MGNLHAGHLELVDIAKKQAENVVVSIFVNPAQFAPGEDFDRYPRTLDADLDRLHACGGVSAVLAPGASQMYPRGSPGGTIVMPRFVQGLSEDACRPHFFTGVATVCLKLFNLCKPDLVVFGQKDAMQCAVIANMLEDLLLADTIQLLVAPTAREPDGLARSSRNSYLTPTMRQIAPSIYAALADATSAPKATSSSVRSAVHERLTDMGMEVEYVSVADPISMTEKDDGLAVAGSVVSVACLLREGDQQCRLIDNVVVPM